MGSRPHSQRTGSLPGSRHLSSDWLVIPGAFVGADSLAAIAIRNTRTRSTRSRGCRALFSTLRSRCLLTPTLVRFGGVLFLSLAVLAPWPSARPIGIILGLGALAGLAYQIKVVIMRRKVELVLLDWYDRLPYEGVPALGSGSLIVGAVGLLAERSFAPYAIAAATALLLFSGIYGAWDLTLWMIKNRDKT